MDRTFETSRKEPRAKSNVSTIPVMKRIGFAVAFMGVFMSALDSRILIVSIPTIVADLSADTATVVWVSVSYQLVLTIFLSSAGRIGDLYGRKRIFDYGFLLFIVGSALSALAQNGLQLASFRVVQGLGGAILVATSTAMITDLTPKQKLGRMLGIRSAIWASAAMAGPVLGGLLVATLGWRSIFYVNIPVGGLALLLSRWKLRDTNPGHTTHRFDILGALTFSVSLTAFLLVLTLGADLGWNSPSVLGLITTSVIAGTAFALLEFRHSMPMIDPRLFKIKSFSVANLAALVHSIAMFMFIFLIVFFLQLVLGYDVGTVGLVLFTIWISTSLTAPVSGWLSDRFGSAPIATTGLIIKAAVLIQLVNLDVGADLTYLVSLLFIMGIGSGLFFPPNTRAVMSSAPGDKRGIASGVLTTMQNMGIAISLPLGVAILATVIPYPTLTEILQSGVGIGDPALSNLFRAGLSRVFFLGSLMMLLAAGSTLFSGFRTNRTK